MREQCYTPEEMERIRQVGESPEERAHLEACPRCRALLLSYGEFVEDDSVPESADLRDAHDRLRRAFDEAQASAGRTVRPSSRPGLLRRLESRLRARWRLRLLVPAACAVVLAVLLYGERGRLGGGPDVLRGPAGPAGNRSQPSLRALPPRPHGSDGVELRWRALPGASTYEVLIFGSDLRDQARIGPLTDTTCVVRRSDLRPAPPSGSAFGWQVSARLDSGGTAQSSPAAASFP